MRSFDYRRLGECLWDGEVVSLLSQIHEYKGRQDLFVSQRPSSVARLVEIAKVQSVESSNRIEGIVTTKARIRSWWRIRRCPVIGMRKRLWGIAMC